MSRVLLAMSGGVDSSVAAWLLTRNGHEVIGVFMRHGSEAETCDSESAPSLLPIIRSNHKQGCCSAQDADDARQVADRLEIPFYALDLQNDFDRIIDYFVDEYSAGRTPNPCIRCNNWLKFGRLFDYAESIGADYVATGHYARLTSHGGVPSLFRGVDADKDQSYVLFGVERDRLGRMMLPVGDFNKAAIREMARETGLRVFDKKDSQEICFVTTGKHEDFVAARIGEGTTAGEFVTTDGAVVGEHSGIERFTIGQRKGLGIALGEPYFVVEIDAKTNRVVIGKKEELARSQLYANETNWLIDELPETIRCTAQIRYNSDAVPATATALDGNRLHVRFDEPYLGVAPGQAVVIYQADRVLGGGWIE